MSLLLPKVYPITDTEISGLSHTEQVKRLIDGGATLIQLREKRKPSGAFVYDAAEAVRVAQAAGVKIIINDRVDVALAVDAEGVHLGQTDMPVEAARRLVKPDAIIGFSTHNLEQVQAALRLPIDYLAFGPIHPTTSKANPDPVAGLEQLRRVRQLAGSLPVVAIGGIDQRTALEALNAGANAIAIISALLANPARIAEALRDLLSGLRQRDD